MPDAAAPGPSAGPVPGVPGVDSARHGRPRTASASRTTVAGRDGTVAVEALPGIDSARHGRPRVTSSVPGPALRSAQTPGSLWGGAPSRGWGRAASVAALCALVLHAVVSVSHAHDLLFALLVGLMSLGCAVCAVRCLRVPCRSELTALLGMSAAMVAVHVAWLLAASPAGGSHHSGGVGTGAGHAASGMGTAMLGLALAEVLVAALCALALRRTRNA